jgi:hypothetical protein
MLNRTEDGLILKDFGTIPILVKIVFLNTDKHLSWNFHTGFV